MPSHQDQTNRPGSDERGAALIVSLILLLIMTIIGISAMNGARLEVSMAGMMQREEIALRGAERTLRAAERYVENSVGTFDAAKDGHYHYLPEDADEDKLDPSVTDWTNIDSLTRLPDHPELSELGNGDAFVVEYLGEMTLPGSSLNDGADVIPGDRVNAYRITTRSESDGRAVRIIEAIYTKLYNPMAP